MIYTNIFQRFKGESDNNYCDFFFVLQTRRFEREMSIKCARLAYTYILILNLQM